MQLNACVESDDSQESKSFRPWQFSQWRVCCTWCQHSLRQAARRCSHRLAKEWVQFEWSRWGCIVEVSTVFALSSFQ
jgi:hypothetical protein